ncbi:MAG: hypothetical protein M3536_04805 [Actinomycetota bacterium]|nr:hypothetical protein [Actinomycetota bacterium]
MAKITAPIQGFNGEVAGVHFKDSVAETDNAAVISYCAGAGYKVELGEPTPEPVPVVPNAEGDAPTGNASKADWLAYALTQGYTEEGLEGRTRDEIRTLINEE